MNTSSPARWARATGALATLSAVAIGPSPAMAQATAAAPQIDAAAVQRCRIIPEAPARLACYDAIALPGVGSRAGWGAPAPGAAAPAARSAAAPGEAPSPAASFGFERKLAEGGPDRLESRLRSRIDGWNSGTRFTLENGQVWQISDGSSAYYPNLVEQPRVTITRGVLGSFFIAIEGVTQQPRVRRVQ